MKSFNYSVFFFLFLFFVSHRAVSQRDYQGCHYHRNKVKSKPLTAKQKLLIQDSNARSDTFDILHYDINLDVTNYNGHFIAGETTVLFTPKINDRQSITFDLMNLQVDSVIYQNNTLAFESDSLELTVLFDTLANVEDTISITVFYQGNPYQDPEWGGFYFESGYIYNLGIGLTTIPPNFGKVWYPCFDSFVERATYSYHIKSAGEKKAYCQGDFLGEEQLLGDTVIRNFEFQQPIPTFLSAIAVSSYETIEYDHPGENGIVPITLTAKSNSLTAMESKFQHLGDAIDALEYWYGPYIWGRVGYVLTTDGALEIPTNIAYPVSMMGAEVSLANNEALFSHELGHQWWGNVVAPKIHNDMWIKEGPAEYSSHLFVEWSQGEAAFEQVVKDNQLFVLENAHIDDEGFWPLSPMPDEHIYGRHTYYKGASIMHNLRGYLGDSLFRETLHQVQANNTYTSVDAEEFKELLEEASSYDLNSFFNDWVYSPGYSTFVVDSFASTVNGNQFNTTVYLKQLLRAAPNFHTNIPIELAAVNNSWDKEYFSASVSGQYSQVEIQTNYLPEEIIFNPRNKLNGARMDEEIVLRPDETFNQTLHFADIKIKKNEVSDSARIQVSHIWSGPEQELGEYIDEISSTHYWEITGAFPEVIDFEGRIFYHGSDDVDLDFDLAANTEEGILPLFRPNSSTPWQEYPDYEEHQGGLTNGSGYFKLFHLRKGQYAFGRGTTTVKVDERKEPKIILYPNPATDEVLLSNLPQGIYSIQVYDGNGKKIKEQLIAAEDRIDVKKWVAGSYKILFFDQEKQVVFQSNIAVIH